MKVVLLPRFVEFALAQPALYRAQPRASRPRRIVGYRLSASFWAMEEYVVVPTGLELKTSKKKNERKRE